MNERTARRCAQRRSITMGGTKFNKILSFWKAKVLTRSHDRLQVFTDEPMNRR